MISKSYSLTHRVLNVQWTYKDSFVYEPKVLWTYIERPVAAEKREHTQVNVHSQNLYNLLLSYVTSILIDHFLSAKYYQSSEQRPISATVPRYKQHFRTSTRQQLK